MSFVIRWNSHIATNCLHAADALWRGDDVVDERLTDTLLQPSRALGEEIQRQNLPEEKFWRQLLCMAHQFDNKRQLMQIVLYRSVGMTKASDTLLASLGGRLNDLQQAYMELFPNVLDELELRTRPLMEQWQTRGPGMLRIAGSLFDEKAIAPGADVLMVQPVRGGHGVAQLYNNTVRFEAVLANPRDDIPEVVRLFWLFLQLNLDLPAFSENIPGDRLPLVAASAMLPIALHAASELDLTLFHDDAIANTVAHWRMPSLPHAELSEVINDWWNVFHSTNTPLPIALSALDQMLFPE